MKLPLSRVLYSVIISLFFIYLFVGSASSVFAEIPPGTTVKYVMIFPQTQWTDSGLDVDQYSTVNVKTEGTAAGGAIYVPGFTYYAFGNYRSDIHLGGVPVPYCYPTSSYFISSVNCWSLIGSINKQDHFPVGTKIEYVGAQYSFKPVSSGRLYFGPNSLNTYDLSQTTGYWNITVILNQQPVPIPSPSLTPSPSPKTPLILIPGIGGSELKVNEETIWSKDNGHGGIFNYNYLANEKVWVNEAKAILPGDDDYFDVLRMKADGINSEANIGLTGNLYAGAYQETINFFTSDGYSLNQDFFVFPYDWRKDILDAASLLDQKIQQIKQQTGSQKVDIVAHSMGGLVSRAYISDSIKAQNVRKLFTLGTPLLGAVEFIKYLRYGGCFTKPELQNLPFCLGLDGEEIKDVIQNMISGFQLIPSQIYFNFYSGEDSFHPLPYRTEFGPLNYSQIKNLLIGFGHNTALFTSAETFHNLDNSLSNTNGVEVTIVAGSGIQTLGQIIEKTILILNGNRIVYKDKIDINGDKTVPLFSASITDSQKGIFLNGSAQVFYTNQEHGELITNGPALNLVKNILEDKIQLPEGVSNQPYPLPLLYRILSVHSPVNIHVYDANGNYTGPKPDGDFEANIPGSSYDTLGDAKFIYLPENGVYDIRFDAMDNGSFDFKIKKFENDVNTSTILYNNIPLTNSTKAQTTFDTSATQAPVLQLDNDGDGTADQQIDPATLTGGANLDSIPPQTNFQLSGTQGNNNWYRSDATVTLTAQDEASGSGIDKIEYTLDNGQTIQTYIYPFTVSQEGTNKLKFHAIDKAGNEEDPKEVEIKIDKTAPEVKVFVDQDKLDIAVEGMDTNPTTVTIEPNSETGKKDDAVYIVTDIAGNTTKIDVRERDKERQDRFRIYSLQYNNNPRNILENNHFNVIYNGKKGKLNIREQNFELRNEIIIRIKYDSKKNQSTIFVKEPKQERIKEIKNGLVILQLMTNKGLLETNY